MKVVEVGHHCCVRLQKQAMALLEKGHQVHLVGKRLPNWPEFTSLSYFSTVSQLREALRVHKKADIVHVHNEPSWMMLVAKEILPKVPVVLDIHDAMIFRSTELKYKSAEERIAFDWADGLVFVGEKCRRIINPKQPSCILPSYVNDAHYQYQAWQWIGGVAYEGRIDTPTDKPFMQYANYVDACSEFFKAGIPFHIYAPGGDSEKKKKCYEQICHLCKTLPYDKLIMTLGCHDWGLCGNTKEYREWDLAVPNKLFEYMAGGIPIVAMNCAEVEKFVKKHGVGIAVKSVQELKDRWDERQQCQKNVFAKRFKFSMENNIHILEDFYKGLI
jgi:glycosyltransferase involved in cell wall biosynthesis